MKKKRPAELSDKFIKNMKAWQKLEDETIRFSEATLKKSKNPIIRMTMEMIKSDSQKHKIMQQMLIDSLTKEALCLSVEELAMLSEGLGKHMAAEEKSLELAYEALMNSELFVTRYMLSLLIADEEKHHSLLGKLDELKQAVIFVT